MVKTCQGPTEGIPQHILFSNLNHSGQHVLYWEFSPMKIKKFTKDDNICFPYSSFDSIIALVTLTSIKETGLLWGVFTIYVHFHVPEDHDVLTSSYYEELRRRSPSTKHDLDGNPSVHIFFVWYIACMKSLCGIIRL